MTQGVIFMMKFRKSISLVLAAVMLISVIIAVPSSSSAAEDYRAWKQTDKRWSSISLGDSVYTIGSSGCLVSSVAKLLIQAEFRNADSFNIADLANWLNSNSGYDSSGNLYWAKVSTYAPGFSFYGNLLNYSSYDSEEYNSKLIDWINAGYHMALQVKSGGHWIAVDEEKTLSRGQVYIMDSTIEPRADLTLKSRYSTFNRITAYKGGSTPKPIAETTEQTDVVTTETIENTDTTYNPTEQTSDPAATEPTSKPIVTELSTEYDTENTTSTEQQSTAVEIYGDINGDGIISIKDASAVQRHIALLKMISDERIALADVDGDNTVSVKDASCIQKYIAALEHNSKTGEKMK